MAPGAGTGTTRLGRREGYTHEQVYHQHEDVDDPGAERGVEDKTHLQALDNEIDVATCTSLLCFCSISAAYRNPQQPN